MNLELVEFVKFGCVDAVLNHMAFMMKDGWHPIHDGLTSIDNTGRVIVARPLNAHTKGISIWRETND